MEWLSEGYILSVRKHGEAAAIVNVLTPDHGRHAGLVHGGMGRRMRPILQPGNYVRLRWQARLAEHLGTFTAEPIHSYAAELMQDRTGLVGLNALCAMAMTALPERQPYKEIFTAFGVVIENLHAPELWPALFVKWEQGVLSSLGYGLDLSQCVASGVQDNLTHVSTRSGRAVSQSMAEPYKNKLFKLPSLMLGGTELHPGDALNGLKITAHFIERRILWPVNRTLPEARLRLINIIEDAIG